MSAEMVKARLNGEYEIVLPKHRADREQWYTAEGWERARLAALHNEIIRQRSVGGEPVVYYAGAEEGEMPALCQMWGAKVVLFEPNYKVWPNIRVIWEANKLEPPAALFVGFASNSTELQPPNPQHVEPAVPDGEWPNCAWGEVIGDHGFKELYQESDAIPQIKIDDMVARTGIVPTIMSIDVEGSEWEVLRGAERTLDEHHPTVFSSGHPEFLFRMFGEYLNDLRKWLKDKGYREQLLAYDHEVHLLYECEGVV